MLPEYLVSQPRTYSTDEASRSFYSACSTGHLNEVENLVADSTRSQADLQYGLEEAAHSFQIDIVRYLMQEHNVKLHTRVFERIDETHAWPPQSIFTSESSKLLKLLQVFLESGWHPNQVWTSPSESRWDYRLFRGSQQNVALHFPRCVQDMPILKLLLEHGADPTVFRYSQSSYLFPPNYQVVPPVQRKRGDVLDMAAKIGTIETIDLLLSYGAKLEYGAPLHWLVRRNPALGYYMPVPAPDPLRLKKARYLLDLGVDINGRKNVTMAVKPHSLMSIGGRFLATPLSHAAGSRDWDFVEWLLENGADPNAHDRRAFDRDDLLCYGIGGSEMEVIRDRLSEFIAKVKGGDPPEILDDYSRHWT